MTKYLSKKRRKSTKLLKEKFVESSKTMPFYYPMSTLLGVGVAERN